MHALGKLFNALVIAGSKPPALWIGLAGAAIVAFMLVPGPLEPFASAWYIPALLSVIAWLAMAATQVDPAVLRRLRYQLAGNDPYLIQALERRDALADQIVHLPLEMVRADARAMLAEIDRRFLPELATRIDRHRTLQRALAQHARGQGPLVGARSDNIALLQRLAADQRQVLEGLIARLADMNAALIGLSHESDSRLLIEQTHQWSEDLNSYWQTTAEIFRSSPLQT